MTEIHGTQGYQWPIALEVDEAGNCYVFGVTSSPDFPVTSGAFDTTYNGGNCDLFVVKLNPTGAVSYATFLGGSSHDGVFLIAYGYGGIVVDKTGVAYVSGATLSADFPVTDGAYDTTFDGGDDTFVAALNPQGSDLIFSTFLGGSGYDEVSSIAIDQNNNIYVTGWTDSSNYPVTPGALRLTPSQSFLSKLNASATALVYSTYISAEGCFGHPTDLTLDASGNAYVGAYPSGITKVNSDGTAIIFSKKIAEGAGAVSGVDIDSMGNLYLSG